MISVKAERILIVVPGTADTAVMEFVLPRKKGSAVWIARAPAAMAFVKKTRIKIIVQLIVSNQLLK